MQKKPPPPKTLSTPRFILITEEDPFEPVMGVNIGQIQKVDRISSSRVRLHFADSVPLDVKGEANVRSLLTAIAAHSTNPDEWLALIGQL